MLLYRKSLLLSITLLCFSEAYAQKADSLFNRSLPDTSSAMMNMDAVYNRPFLTVGKMPVALGGYL